MIVCIKNILSDVHTQMQLTYLYSHYFLTSGISQTQDWKKKGFIPCFCDTAASINLLLVISSATVSVIEALFSAKKFYKIF